MPETKTIAKTEEHIEKIDTGVKITRPRPKGRGRHRGPRIIHSVGESPNILKRLISVFSERVLYKGLELVASGKIGTKELRIGEIPDADAVGLRLRKALVEATREGMLARKNQEEIIAALAALVWLQRVDPDMLDKIQGKLG